MAKVEAETAADLPVSDEEFASAKRALGGWQKHLFYWLAVVYVLFHLYVLNLSPMEPLLYRSIHIAGGSILALMLYKAWGGDGRESIPWYDWVLIAVALAVVVHMAIELDGILFRAGAIFTTGDVLMGVAGTLLLLEVTRRTAGLALPIICAVFIVYCFVGHWFAPGTILYHRGYGFERFFTYIYSEYGVFSVTTQVSSTFIILFVVFAAFLQVSKVGDYINDLSFALFGRMTGGPAKATVASGVMFGSISGSAVANVVASGMVSIPMMRRTGYDRATAGAIEATSSTGGQITPPVLGAGAFLMAEITGIAYADIAYASIIPCALFYVACLAHVDFHARLAGMRGLSGSELPAVRPLVLKLYLFAPLVMLVWALLAGYSTFRAGSLGIITALVVVWVAFYLRLAIGRGRSAATAAMATDRILLVLVGAAVLFLIVEGAAPETVTAATTWLPSLGYNGVWVLVGIIVLGLLASGEHRRLIFDGLDQGARDSIQLICVCGSAGIIVGVIALTGLGGRFADVILAIAGESKLLAMVFTMVITLILGMGMPTTAAYAIAAAVVAPGLIRIGVPPLVAHMFIFYFAVLSAITPPVALASFAAAAMAKADPWKTSFIAGKMGFATFLVPFMFFYNAALLGQGSFLDILQPVATACAGVVLLAAATEGWLFGRLQVLWRVVIGVAALLLIHPGSATDLAGIVLAAIGIAGATVQRRKLGTAA